MSVDEHIPSEVLSSYADDPASVANRDAVEAHLARCAACWTELDDYRKFESAVSDEETWWQARQVATSATPNELAELAERVAAEDHEANRMLSPLLDSQYRFTFANVARKRRFQTAGVVRVLCRTAHEECDREPRFALLLAETAAFIAEGLPETYYDGSAINELRGTAWKEYATACRYLGRFSEGFDALDRAERAYRRLIDPGSHNAVVSLSRALLLWEQQRYEEALRFARSSARVFANRRETERYLQAKETEAIILHRMGDLASACDTYKQLIETADVLGDAEMKARAARNLGVAAGDRGDTGLASKYALIALQLYQALGQRAMICQTRWLIGWITLLAGNAEDAAQRLRLVIADFVELSMRADAARAQVDLADALLVLGKHTEVVDVCTTLVSYFRGAGMLTGALTAAAFMKEAATKRVLTRTDIAHVRRYLTELERSPDLPFAPPPPIF